MKTTLLTLCLSIITVVLLASPTLATDYFVIKSRSGILRVVDHEPKGGASVVKGPFKTFEEAKKAIKGITAPGR